MLDQLVDQVVEILAPRGLAQRRAAQPGSINAYPELIIKVGLRVVVDPRLKTLLSVW